MQQWYLYGFVIQLAEDKYTWTQFRNIGERMKDFSGSAEIIDKTIVMNLYKIREEWNDEDPDKVIATLPKWDKTKYFIVEDDGGIRLMDCVTGALVNYRKIPIILTE